MDAVAARATPAAEAEPTGAAGVRPSGVEFGRVVALPKGLPGFPGATRFRLAPLPGGAPGPCWLLRSADGAGLAFVVLPLAPDSGLIERADIERACRDLGLDTGGVLVLLILNPRPKEGGGVEVYANLRAPLLIDTGRRIGYQHVLANPHYPVRVRLDEPSSGV